MIIVRFPVVVVCAGFIIGGIVSTYAEVSVDDYLAGVLLGICFLIGFGLMYSYRWRVLAGLPVFLSGFILGMFNYKNDEKAFIREIPTPNDTLQVVIKNINAITWGKISFEGLIVPVDYKVKGVILTYGKKDKFSIDELDTVVCQGYAFDVRDSPYLRESYRSYLKNKGLDLYISIPYWKIIRVGKKDKISLTESPIHYVKREIVKMLEGSTLSEDTRAIVMALLVGDRRYLDSETQRAFQVNGLVHILSVSGMHVGLLFSFLLIVFGFLGVSSSIIKVPITLIVLWFYCAMCGFEPATVRATLMLSIMVVGMALGRSVSSLSSLGVVALATLLIEHRSLFLPGFQFSYMAMLGIITTLPLFDKLLNKDSFLLRLMFENIGITLSAQIFTLPLILYYYGNFPTYFLISNLILGIPFTFFTYLVFLTGIVGFIPYISDVVFFVDNIVWGIIKSIIEFFAGLPYAMIENIHFSSVDCYISYALLFVPFVILLRGMVAFIFYIMAVVVSLAIVVAFRDVPESKKQLLTLTEKEQKVIVLWHNREEMIPEKAWLSEISFECDTMKVIKKGGRCPSPISWNRYCISTNQLLRTRGWYFSTSKHLTLVYNARDGTIIEVY